MEQGRVKCSQYDDLICSVCTTDSVYAVGASAHGVVANV
jgi:hypothetical protein